MNKCQPIALGVAVGIVWSIGVFFAGIFAMFHWGNAFVDVIGSFYIGYGASLLGAVIGALWALADGFVAGVVVAWIYNAVAK
jgi:hypothetical protein